MAPILRSPHGLLMLLAAWAAILLPVTLHAAPTLDDSYRLQPGDALVITLLGEPDFGGSRAIGPAGTIQLPLIGSVRAAGQTVPHLREAIARALRDVILDPYLTVALDELNSKRRVYVTGRVEKLGSQMLPLGATMVDALAAAGLVEDSDLTAVQLTRADGQTRQLDLSGLQTGRTLPQDLAVRWDDRLYVPRREARVTIVGQVKQPGSYLLPADRPLRVLDLITQVSGGFIEGAEYRTMLLLRKGQSQPQVIDLVKLLKQGDLSQNYELQADDVLVTPEADRIAVAGEVLKPSAFYATGKVTVLEALANTGGFTPQAGLRQAQLTHADGSKTPVDLEALWRRGELKYNIDLMPGDVLMIPRADPEEALVSGAVLKPGVYDLRDVKDRSLLRALTLLGPAPTADLTRVSLFRGDTHRVCNVRQVLQAGDQDNNPSLQPGDVVYVPDTEKVLVIGAFPRPGRLPFDPAWTVMDYIAEAGGLMGGHLELGMLIRPQPDGTSRTVRLNLSQLHAGVLPDPVKVVPGDIIYVPPRPERRSVWDKMRDFIVTLGAVRSLWR